MVALTFQFVCVVIISLLSAEAHSGGSQEGFRKEDHSSNPGEYKVNPLAAEYAEKSFMRDQESREESDDGSKKSRRNDDHSNKFEKDDHHPNKFAKQYHQSNKFGKEEKKLEKHFLKDFPKVMQGILHKSEPGLAREILQELEIASGREETSTEGNPNHGEIQSRTDVISQQRNRAKYYRWVKKFNSERCGQQDIQPLWTRFRIIGGRETIPGSWPWMASMLHDVMGHWCAATLISQRWVVTARHCFDYPFNLTDHWFVRLGKYDISMEEEITEQDYSIKTLIGHPLYSPRDFDNDIALIQLDRPVNMTSFVSPICLGSKAPADNQECVVTGWGKTSEGVAEPYSDTLQQVAIPIMNHDECSALYENLTTNTLCAGLFRGGLDSCQGDSGGPLQCQVDNKWFIDGITSWGGRHFVECGRPNQPGVYTRLVNYRAWILKQIYSHAEGENDTE